MAKPPEGEGRSEVFAERKSELRWG